MKRFHHSIFIQIARKFPYLPSQLKQADKHETPQEFVKKMFIGSIYASISISAVLFVILNTFNRSILILLPVTIISFFFFFFYFMKLPQAIILRKGKDIDKEILFAGKFLIVELKSGVPLYQAMKNISIHYEHVGKYFKRILDDVDLGESIEEAINKEMLLAPSENFQKLLWQIVNSIQTGAEISTSLNSVLDQISRRQMIEVERYAKKLNPIAMFYLMGAIVFPSLGMVMLTAMVSFIGIQISLGVFIVIVMMLVFVQFMFLAIIKSSRPAVEI